MSVSSSASYIQGCFGRYFSQIPNKRSISLAFLADIGTNSSNLCCACMVCSQGAMSPRRFTMSSLLAIKSVGMLLLSSDTTLSSAMLERPASTTNSTKSTSLTAPCTVLLSERFKALPCRVWKPGVSTKTNCTSPRVRMPVMRWRVVCALREVMLIFWPTRALSRVDLPTLGLPTIAIKPQRWDSTGTLGAVATAAAAAAESISVNLFFSLISTVAGVLYASAAILFVVFIIYLAHLPSV